ncbi:hypothetical protein OPV22_026670 [Ensete ventricosum]|uniref:Uncharacterized protein n=1 Tax=Ensete ventricosum TaxID=4639 RepID=A0AAV8Q349_ENSVE|nr:hypothetical protein OPV22_026670 [Ensete ventricosum]
MHGLLCSNLGDYVSNANGALSGHTDFSLNHEISSRSSPMIQDMGCHWTCNDQEGFVSQLPAYAYQLNLAKAKEWLTDNSFRKLNGFFKDHRDQDDQPHEKFFMRALASHGQTDGLRPLPENSSFDGYEGDHVGESRRRWWMFMHCIYRLQLD